METMLNIVFPVLMYTFGIILLIVLIVLVMQLIQILKKVDRIVDNVEDKVNSLNGVFTLIDKTTDSIALFSGSIVNTLASLIYKFVGNKKKKKNTENEKEEDLYE